MSHGKGYWYDSIALAYYLCQQTMNPIEASFRINRLDNKHDIDKYRLLFISLSDTVFENRKLFLEHVIVEINIFPEADRRIFIASY